MGDNHRRVVVHEEEASEARDQRRSSIHGHHRTALAQRHLNLIFGIFGTKKEFFFGGREEGDQNNASSGIHGHDCTALAQRQLNLSSKITTKRFLK